MAEIDQELSDAILAYLQWGTSAWPRRDREAVKSAATTSDVEVLADRAAAVSRECGAIPVDWSSMDLTEAGAMARAEMARRHPELDDAALDALRWVFSYAWK